MIRIANLLMEMCVCVCITAKSIEFIRNFQEKDGTEEFLLRTEDGYIYLENRYNLKAINIVKKTASVDEVAL